MSKKDRDGMSKRELFRERRRRNQTRNRLIAIGLIVVGAVLVALFLVLALLFAAFGSLKHALLVFTGVLVVIMMAGSIWVMHHLNANMMPTHDMRIRP